MHHERISGIESNAMKASLNRDSVLVLISELRMIMKKMKPIKKNGKGQYTFSRHTPSDSLSENPVSHEVQLSGEPVQVKHGSLQAVQLLVVVFM